MDFAISEFAAEGFLVRDDHFKNREDSGGKTPIEEAAAASPTKQQSFQRSYL